MGLSKQEQQILEDIERNLTDSDPRFARRVGTTTAARYVLASSKLSIVALVVGLALMLGLVVISVLGAFVGFLIMLVGALGLERNLRSSIRPVTNRTADFSAGSRPDSARG